MKARSRVMAPAAMWYLWTLDAREARAAVWEAPIAEAVPAGVKVNTRQEDHEAAYRESRDLTSDVGVNGTRW